MYYIDKSNIFTSGLPLRPNCILLKKSFYDWWAGHRNSKDSNKNAPLPPSANITVIISFLPFLPVSFFFDEWQVEALPMQLKGVRVRVRWNRFQGQQKIGHLSFFLSHVGNYYSALEWRIFYRSSSSLAARRREIRRRGDELKEWPHSFWAEQDNYESKVQMKYYIL